MTNKAAAIEVIKAHYGNELISIYQTGLTDASLLSDLDLIIVTKDGAQKDKPIVKDKIDVRAALTRAEFAAEQIYLPYTTLECIYGDPVAPTVSAPKEAPLVKLAGMFFYAFLRNYYRYFDCPGHTEEILIFLNDFEYVPLLAPELADVSGNLLAKIRDARKRFPGVTEEEVQALLKEAIAKAWELCSVLAKKLNEMPSEGTATAQVNPLRENTVFLNEDAAKCRQCTEKHIFAARTAKKLYLPFAFKRLVTAPEKTFIYEYAQKNLKGPRIGKKGWLKHQTKMLF